MIKLIYIRICLLLYQSVKMESIIFSWLMSSRQYVHNDIDIIMKEIEHKFNIHVCNSRDDETDIEFNDTHEKLIDDICELYPWARDAWIEFLGDYEDVIIEYVSPYWMVVETNFIVESPRHRLVISKLVNDKECNLEESDLYIINKKKLPYKF